MRGKLHDLKDGCRFQEWEQIAQILQRDMKDFENTIIKLNQVKCGLGAACSFFRLLLYICMKEDT